MADNPGGQEVGRIAVRVLPDTSKFRKRLVADLEKIERSEHVEIDAVPDMDGFREKVKAATQGLDATVSVDVDRSRLSRLRDKITRLLDDGPSPKFNGVNVGGAGVAAGVAALALAGPAVGLLSASLAALPGLLSAVVAPVGAITLGLDGIKAAAGRLKTPFDDLKKTMSAITELQFAPVFDKLGVLFPVLGRSLPGVSKGVGDLGQSFADTLTSGDRLSKIEATIGNIGRALSDASPGVAGFTSGLVGLAEKFSEKLPSVSAWFSSVGESFDRWVSKVSADGSLSAAFNGLGSTLKTLGEAIVPLLGKGLDFMGDPEKIAKFNAALTDLGTALKSVMNDSIALYGVINDVKNVFSGFDFSGIWDDLSKPFTSQDAPWRSMVADLQSAWNSAVSATQSAWQSVVSSVQSAWQSASSAVSTGVGTVVQFVSELPGKVVSALGDLGSLLVSAGKAIMDGLLSGIKSGVQAVYDFVSGIAGKIASLKGPLPYDRKVLIPNGQALMEGLGMGIENGLNPVLDKVRGIAGQVQDAMTVDGAQIGAPNTSLGGSKYAQGAMGVGRDFAEATGGQLLSDLGISGNGAIPALANYGLELGEWAAKNAKSFTINVNSVDEAISAWQRKTSLAMLTYLR